MVDRQINSTTFGLWGKPETRGQHANSTEKAQPFNINQGIRQGCPFSPLVFLLVLQMLTLYLQKLYKISQI